jgi:uncharacterized integral membrane protein
MIRIILSIVSLLVLSFIIVLNIQYKTSFSLFFRVYEDIPVVVIAFLSFVLGIIYSFGYYVYGRIRKAGSEKIRRKKEELKVKEKELKGKAGKDARQETPPPDGGPL